MSDLYRSNAVFNRLMLRCLLIALLFFLAGCSTARLGQFSQFAAAGQAYTTALPKVLDIALQSTIEANSYELIDTRLKMTPEQRRCRLEEFDEEIGRRAQAFQTIKAQTNLLSAYFTSLAALAESDADEDIAKSTQDAADALAKVSKDVAALKIGKAPAKDVIGQGVPIVVAAFRQAKLEKVLKATVGSVGLSIDIHIALLEHLRVVVLDDQMLLGAVSKTRPMN